MLPNFIVIGAGKAGTTSLWGYLREHPQIFMSEPKELNFFTTEHNWNRGLAWYESHFDNAGNALAIGEVTGSYANWPNFDGVPQRMFEILPDAKLVYVIRHPIERIVSAFKYMTLRGDEDKPMDEAIRTNPMYLSVSSYATQIEQFLKVYPKERLHVIVSEEMRDDRPATIKRVFEFLGVDSDVELEILKHEFNRTDRKLREPRALLRRVKTIPGYKPLVNHLPNSLKQFGSRLGTRDIINLEETRLSDETRSFIEDSLRDDLARLHTHLGEDFHCWGLSKSIHQ
ncbi:MAG: sulfotransferase domain-containing protein [Acidimicrobiales bacterium]